MRQLLPTGRLRRRNAAASTGLSRQNLCGVMVSDSGREAPPDAITFYRRAGWIEPSIESYRARFGGFGKHIHPLPDSFQRLRDGDTLRRT